MNVLSGVLFFVAFIPYVWAIVHGQTVPSPVTWAIWASVDTLTLFAMIKEKAVIGQITGAVIGAWVVTILAIFYGNPTMGSIEWVSVVGALAGILLWKTTGNAILAVICAQIAVLIGAVPTIVGVCAGTLLEDPIAWSLWSISCIPAFLAIKKWDIANVLQPLSFAIVDVTIFVLVMVRLF